MTDTPKVEPPKDCTCKHYSDLNKTIKADPLCPVHRLKDEIMNKFWAIFNKHFPQPITGNLPAFDKEVEALLKLQQEALLDRVEKEVIGEHEFPDRNTGFWKAWCKGRNGLRADQRTAVDKLRLEL